MRRERPAPTSRRRSTAAKVVVAGVGKYVGEVAQAFKIYDQMKNASISVAGQTFTGKALKPAPVVKYKCAKLKQGTDNTLSYS